MIRKLILTTVLATATAISAHAKAVEILNSDVAKPKYPFPKLELVTIDDTFGGWAKAQKTFFADGGVFDSIYQPK